MTRPTTTLDLEVEFNHSQVYIYSVAPWETDPEGHNAVLRALDDAHKTDRFVGVSDGLIDFVTAAEWNFSAPMRVETWETDPPADGENWDHVVDVDLDVPNGRLMFEGSGGRPPIPCEVPSGQYRARLSGRGYEEAKEGAEGLDSYRLQLWPRDQDTPPVLLKRWPGFEAWG
ncbi:hypothetical protein BBK82_10595 [Lentzea guizhouensis]|uniref:Uncharacterized protein n=1 Tax=Lentzea guizhouensis TaxID=1586287 RepID=A0A1B2HFG5_9PSEU|nr:hypothetical protein [Lentzea guizhouensis]ANZ36445.1 hypothetical protein BBK82_10595 [Lentzea guizhouensis]